MPCMYRQTTLRMVIGLCALALIPALASGAETLRIQGVYSNIAMTPSEDYQGMEVIISLTDTGYYAVLQCASGADATRPVVVPVKVDEEKGTLEFAAHADPDNTCPMTPFTGRISRDGLRVHYDEGDDVGLLKRGMNFWQ